MTTFDRKSLLEFDDPGAQDDQPVRGVTIGDIRAWHDQYDNLLTWAEGLARLLEQRNIELHACQHTKFAAERVCWFDWSDNDGDARAAIDALRDILKAVDYTLTVHGHIDRETPLHDRVTTALSALDLNTRAGAEPATSQADHDGEALGRTVGSIPATGATPKTPTT